MGRGTLCGGTVDELSPRLYPSVGPQESQGYSTPVSPVVMNVPVLQEKQEPVLEQETTSLFLTPYNKKLFSNFFFLTSLTAPRSLLLQHL